MDHEEKVVVNNLMCSCPRFSSCSAPICPLDTSKDLRTGPFRGEPKCTLGKELLNKLRGENDNGV